MTVLCFAAFSLISVPAYVAMFSNNDDVDMEDDEENPDRPFALPTANTEEWDAAPVHRSNPISGIFQRTRLKRLM
jgi:hypothetical protein